MHVLKMNDQDCRISGNCSQCWDSCEEIQSSRSICTKFDCGPACQEACQFPWLGPVERPPVPVLVEEVLEVQDSGAVRWPSVPGAVFLVLADSQLRQTLEPRARMPGQTVRVWVLDWRGLSRVFGPRPPSPLSQLQAVVRSLGLEKDIPVYRRISKGKNTRRKGPKLLSTDREVNRSWKLHLESMNHDSELVLTQIRWDSQQQSGADSPPMCLVTWEVDGGVLRGNLLTHSTQVTLSLWPDTVYTIQVALLSMDSAGSQSEPLVLDTHLVHTDTPGAIHSPLDTGGQTITNRRTQVVAGVAAAAILFLFLSLALTWRWRHRLSLPHSKLIDEEAVTPNIYRVFPPMFRLITEPKTSSHIFSSTDNLLQGGSCEK